MVYIRKIYDGITLLASQFMTDFASTPSFCADRSRASECRPWRTCERYSRAAYKHLIMDSRR